MLTTIRINSDSDFDFEDDEEEKCEEVKKEGISFRQKGIIACNLLGKKDILKEKIEAVRAEIKQPLQKTSALVQSVQKNWLALQDEPVQSIKDQWDIFFDKLGCFINSFDAFLAGLDQPDLGNKTKELMQQLLDLLDQVKLLNVEGLVNQFLPKSLEDLKEQTESVLANLYQERLFPHIQKSLSQIQGGGLYLSEEKFKSLSYFEQDAVLLGMELGLKLFEEAALMADKIELQFCLKQGSLSSRIFPPVTAVVPVETKTTEEKSDYDLLYLIVADKVSSVTEKNLEKLFKKHKKSPVLIKKGAECSVFGNLNGIWSIREAGNLDSYTEKLGVSKDSIPVPLELTRLLQAYHAPLPSLGKTITQTYTTLAKKYQACMNLAGYSNEVAIELYPYSKAIAKYRKALLRQLTEKIKTCQAQAVDQQQHVKKQAEEAVDNLLKKKNKSSVVTLKNPPKKEKKSR